ncbi:MAG: hypothetical protein JWN46_1606 [Acidimicrobiales bacterium]|nr:hypothetical protein [Acidimicrobiales bacterium]
MTPLWLWPAAALLGVLVAWLAVGFEGNLLVAEGLAIAVALTAGLAGRFGWRRR